LTQKVTKKSRLNYILDNTKVLFYLTHPKLNLLRRFQTGMLSGAKGKHSPKYYSPKLNYANNYLIFNLIKSQRSGYYFADQYGMYFLTFTVVGWVDIFTRKACRDIFLDSLRLCQQNKGLVVHAYVIMSNHVHLVLRAEEGSIGLSSITRDMKKYTSKTLLKWLLNNPKESRKDWLEVVFRYHAKYNSKNTHFQLWQQGNRPKIMLHPRFIWQKLNYIHENPVKAGIVGRAEDYLYSSARNYTDVEEVWGPKSSSSTVYTDRSG
jgi:REP element-mobilizing transposase RayT